MYHHERMRALLHFNMRKDIGVQSEKEQQYDHVRKSIKVSLK